MLQRVDIIETDKKRIIGTYKRQEVVLVSGKGATAIDENQKEYIDFGSGIGVNSLGYCDSEWSNAIASQAATLQHTSNLYYTTPAATLAELLSNETGYVKTLFCNSGAEANECAIKLARKYSFDKYKSEQGEQGEQDEQGEQGERNKILTLYNSFHGRTVTTLAATGQDSFHNFFFPFTKGFVYKPANDIKAVTDELSKGGFCAVMLEFIQGEGGVLPLDNDFVKALFAYCEQNDILIIADEVQTGAGRTGKFLASSHYGVKPNITTLAKGLGGGLPIGACMTDEKACEVFRFGDHGTTFGGNPVVCAGGICVVNRITANGFLDTVLQKGEYIREQLKGLDEVSEITGLGLMLGIKLKTKKAPEVLDSCLKNGLIVLTAKEKIRLLPPLNISQKELEAGVAILKSALSLSC